jgi:hypothetical protein
MSDERKEAFEELAQEQEQEGSEKWGSFKAFSKKISEIYRTDDSLALRTEHVEVNREIFRITNKTLLKNVLRNSYGVDENYRASQVSKGLHALDANYAKIISYYSNMYYIRYVVVPTKATNAANEMTDEEYMEKYQLMLDVIDGMTLESVVPAMLKETYLSGAAYVYAFKNNAAKTISVIILPPRWCRTVLQTNLGTNLIEFDFEYFQQFRSQDDLEQALSVMPEEFRTLLPTVQNQAEKWAQLDPRFATSFMANERSLPPFLNALTSILEYEDYREKEQIKNQNELKAIFVNRIPVFEDKPLFDLNETKAIHAGLKRILKQHDGLQPITVFGESELLKLQTAGERENRNIPQSFETIYNSVGLNSAVASGQTPDALQLTKSVDQSQVWELIVNINNFINVAVNNLYRFRPLQAEISILPIPIVKEGELVKQYRENAAYGIGKLEAIVASGIKQKHIADRAKLERVLDLDNLLKPLQSSHTQSGSDLNSVTSSANGGDSTVDQSTENADGENTSQDGE